MVVPFPHEVCPEVRHAMVPAREWMYISVHLSLYSSVPKCLPVHLHMQFNTILILQSVVNVVAVVVIIAVAVIDFVYLLLSV